MSSIHIGGYVLVQGALLFAKYGLDYNMPNWVVWFPTWAVGGITALMLIILMLLMVVGVLIDSI